MFRNAICHITFSTKGGAGQVAKRLSDGQLKAGTKSRLVSITDNEIPALAISNPLLVSSALLDYFAVRRTQSSQLFSLYRSGTNRRVASEILRDDELLHLHWMPGVLSVEKIGALSKSRAGIVWTLHDMWPLTGGCHHAIDCTLFESGCRKCPQARPIFRQKVSRAFSRKIENLSLGSDITLIVPSGWMAGNVLRSPIFAKSMTHIIPNPVDCDVFTNKSNGDERSRLGISRDAFVVGCSATNLADKMKNINSVVQAVAELSGRLPDRDILLLAVGEGQLGSSKVKVLCTGGLTDSAEIAAAYRAMDVFVTMSLAENFPLTLAEAAASGVPTICLNRGGMPDVVVHGTTGLVLNEQNELVSALQELSENDQFRRWMSENARAQAVSRFSIDSVVKQHEQVYSGVGGGR